LKASYGESGWLKMSEYRDMGKGGLNLLKKPSMLLERSLISLFPWCTYYRPLACSIIFSATCGPPILFRRSSWWVILKLILGTKISGQKWQWAGCKVLHLNRLLSYVKNKFI